MGIGCGALRPAVFFDRDGVLNEPIIRNGKPYPPPSLKELRLIAHAAEGVRALKSRGFVTVIVTNQPDVSRGEQSRDVVDAINATVVQALLIDAVYTCYHDDVDGCDCRKPNPGLLRRAIADLGIDERRSYLIGDRYKDISAGKAAGCATIFIDYGYVETPSSISPDVTVTSLEDAVQEILNVKGTSTYESRSTEG